MNKIDAMFFYIEEVRKLENCLTNLVDEWKRDAYPSMDIPHET